jgi:hypothetical protein
MKQERTQDRRYAEPENCPLPTAGVASATIPVFNIPPFFCYFLLALVISLLNPHETSKNRFKNSMKHQENPIDFYVAMQ